MPCLCPALNLIAILRPAICMQVDLVAEDRYMVLCSDGIYEFMGNDEIMGLVHARAQQGAAPAAIAQHLVRSHRPLLPYCSYLVKLVQWH